MAEDQNARYKARPGQEIPGESFGEAFKRHKAAGRPDFSWRGQTYSTKTAQEQGREIKAAEGSGRGTYAGRTDANRDTAPLRTAPTTGRAEIPGQGGYKAPASTDDGMSETARNVLNTMNALGPGIGSGLGAAMRGARAIGSAVRATGPAARGAEAERVASRIEPRLRRSGESVEESVNQARAEMAREPRMRRSGESVEESVNQARAEMAREPRMRRSGESVEESVNQARSDMAREPRMRRSGESVDEAMKQARLDMAREPRLEPARPLSASERQAPTAQGDKPRMTPRSRTREDDEGVEFKRGGKTKAYAKGGSVRGAGIAQRGVRKCKVY